MLRFNSFTTVILSSALIGFCMGLFMYPKWQDALYNAQIVSNTVFYDKNSATYILAVKLWSMTVHIFSFLLELGMTEKTISLIFSGLIGLLSFLPLSLLSYTISKNILASITIPIITYFLKHFTYGIGYEVSMMSWQETNSTLGLFGFHYLLLGVALIVSNFKRVGSLVLLTAISFHPSQALYIYFVFSLSLISYFIHTKNNPLTNFFDLKFSMLAILITLASFAFELFLIKDFPNISSEERDLFIRQSSLYWENHRNISISLKDPSFLLNMLCGSLAIIILKTKIEKNIKLLFYFIAISSFISFLITCISWLPVQNKPTFLLVGMIGRTINFNMYLSLPIILSVLYKLSESKVLSLLLTFINIFCIMIALFFKNLVYELSLLYILISCLSILLIYTSRFKSFKRFDKKIKVDFKKKLLTSNFFILVILISKLGLSIRYDFKASLDGFQDWRNNALYKKLKNGRGPLLTASNIMANEVQIKARRSVFLDASDITDIPYAPESGPAVKKILKDIYKIDFFNPPPFVKELKQEEITGGVPVFYNKVIWENMSLDEWKKIKLKYKVSEILTPTDWELNLKKEQLGNIYNLYTIPQL